MILLEKNYTVNLRYRIQQTISYEKVLKTNC